VVSASFPTLVERAIRLIEARGEPVEASELARALFGAVTGPWVKLLDQVVRADPRVAALPDGHYAIASHTTAPAAGLVVFGAGPKPWRDPIVAIGAARWAGGRLEQNEWLVRPNKPTRVPDYLGKYGVDAAAVEDGAPIDRVLDELLDFVGGAPLAGLDVALGAARLQYALRALGRPQLGNELVELAVPAGERPDLVRLARRAGLVVPERSRPAALAALAARLARNGSAPTPEPPVADPRRAPCPPSAAAGPAHRSIRSVREARASYASGSALDATAWRRLLDARQLAAIPESPGVYRFLGAHGRLLYVGKATSLRARLASYLRGNFPLVRQMPGLVEATATLEWDALPCELAARMREAELIAAERPPYNVQRRSGPALVWARLELDGEAVAGGRVARLRLARGARLDAGVPLSGEATALGTDFAATAALAEAKKRWWPPRPRAAERPTPDDVLGRFRALGADFARALADAEVAGGLRARDLRDGLLVVAPRRPPRREAAPDEPDDEGWTRERDDLEWPPAELLDSPPMPPGPLEEGWRQGLPPKPEPDQLAVLRVDAHGLRAAALIDADADLPSDALAALSDAPEQSGPKPEAGLAALAVLLAAIARAETGLRVWPLARLD
jgi:hypothetical protein